MSTISEDLKNYAKSLSVLLVDSDDKIRVSVGHMLRKVFDKVFIAPNGKEGIEIYKKVLPDIVITDLKLPLLDGVSMIKKMKEVTSGQHVLVIADRNQTLNEISKVMELNIDGLILKQIHSASFYKSLSKVISNIKMQKDIKQHEEDLEKLVKDRTIALQEQLFYDNITKLPNQFKLEIDMELKTYTSLMMVDVDNFNHINMIYGYEIGQDVLKDIADFIVKYLPPGCELYHLTGDRFVVLMGDFSTEESESYAKTLNTIALHHPIYKKGDIEIRTTFTIGIASHDSGSPLRGANTALQEARSMGRNRVVVYKAGSILEQNQQHFVQTINKLKDAIAEDCLVPFYQPIVDSKTQEIVKYECLARMCDTSCTKILSPGYFIEPAKTGGIITHITRVIVEKSFEHFMNSDIEFSINITEEDLNEGYLIEFMHKCSSNYGIEPERVTIEVLEGISASSNSDILKQLEALRDLGFKVAIDDFGVEHSNFSRVHDMGVDIIKIDGSFIKDIHKNEKSFAVAKTISIFAQSIGAKVVAEYVHSEEVWNKVKELNIDYSQGYFFGEPIKTVQK